MERKTQQRQGSLAEREGLWKSDLFKEIECLTASIGTIEAKRFSRGLSNRAPSVLEALFPPPERLDAVVTFELDAATCYAIIRHFDYGLALHFADGRYRVEISEPFFTDDAYTAGRDALRLINRAILWVQRNSDEFATHAIRQGIRLRTASRQ